MPNGRDILATPGSDLRIWDMYYPSDPDLLVSMNEPIDSSPDYIDYEFSPNGRELAVTSINDQYVSLWNTVEIAELASNPYEIACSITGGSLSRKLWTTYVGGLRAPGNRGHFSRLVVGRVSQR